MREYTDSSSINYAEKSFMKLATGVDVIKLFFKEQISQGVCPWQVFQAWSNIFCIRKDLLSRIN
jgi:hypothetical protein